MRLIDADALIEDLRSFFPSEVLEGIEPKTLFAQIMHDIDNAPTVEPCYNISSCSECKNYDKENHNCPRYCEVIKEALTAIKSRPKGEWIDVNGDGSLWKCNNCNETACCKGKFCSDCGADMRGEKE